MKAKQKREHNWTKEDAIINFFYWRFGTKGLLITDEKELVECAIGSTLVSLKKNNLNFNWLNGEGNYCDISKNQKEVFDTYLKTPYEELRDIVNEIITNSDLNQNKAETIAAKKVRDAEKAKKEKAEKLQNEMDEMWRRMGRDPNKMRKVVA